MLSQSKHTFYFVAITLTLVAAYPEGDISKKFGDECQDTDYCRGELISCQNGICNCLNQETMIYDPENGRCFIQSGKTCEGKSGRTDIWKHNVNCVDGAICEEGICICTEGYYEALDGTCAHKKYFKEPCNSDQECGTTYSKALICVHGSCQCDRGQIYDSERRQCVGLVDSECDSENSIYVNECTAHAECRSGKCQCVNGYAKSTQGKCELGYGQSCGGPNNYCADIYFTCINGKCQCEYPSHQYYSEKTEECLSLVSGPCTFPKHSFTEINLAGIYDIQKCTKNAHCVDKGFYSECECKPGYVQRKDGTCAPGYNVSCEAEECDPITPLYCRNNVCLCYDNLNVWDHNVQNCVGLVGARCTVEESECVEYASCVIADREIAGKCLCDKYSEEVSNRTCQYHV